VIVVMQRVSRAEVRVGDEVVGRIGRGLCLLCCALGDDVEADATWLADKLAGLRVFEDEQGRTNRSIREIDGEALVVPQFTLAADWRKGRRPSFTAAADAEQGQALVNVFAAQLSGHGLNVATGRFGAAMAVELINDGPFTLVLDSAARPARRA
jgi:D-tyrosyl-tRNA(Tyr) deacylase